MSEKDAPNINEENTSFFVRTGSSYWDTKGSPEEVETHWPEIPPNIGEEINSEGIETVQEHVFDLSAEPEKELNPSELRHKIIEKVGDFSQTRKIIAYTPNLSRKDSAELARRDRYYGRNNRERRITEGGKICELGFIDLFHDTRFLKEVLNDFIPMRELQIKKTERMSDEIEKTDCFLRFYDNALDKEVVIALDISFNQEKIPEKAARCVRFSREEGTRSDYISFNKDHGKCHQKEHIPLVLVPLTTEEGNMLIDYAKAFEYALLLEAEISKLEQVGGKSQEITKVLKNEITRIDRELENVYRKRIIESNIFIHFIEDALFQLELIIGVAIDNELSENALLAIKQLKILLSKTKLNKTYTAGYHRLLHQGFQREIEEKYLLKQ